MTDVERLRRVFGGEELRWLVDRVRRRLERDEPLRGSVTLANPTELERRAIEQLVGRRPGGGTTVSVSLDEVDAVVRRSGVHDDGLPGVVEVLAGPVMLLESMREAERADWERAYAPLHALVPRRPEVALWLAEGGLVRRLFKNADAARPVLADLARVLDALPVGGMTLARFATTAVGDPHALDAGRPLATLAESAIKSIWYRSAVEPPGRAQRRRDLWESVGILLDELSSTVLCLNLVAAQGNRLHAFTEPARELGEPVVLTLRQLGRERPVFTGAPVFVCENPAVVAAAADELGAACPPLVCVNGQPSTAGMRLLEALHASGAPLRYHGDFDWGGLRIANLLYARVPWRPWRFDTQTYERAVGWATAPLAGAPVRAAWDDALHDALLRHGRRVHEELVLGDLVADLRVLNIEPGVVGN